MPAPLSGRQQVGGLRHAKPVGPGIGPVGRFAVEAEEGELAVDVQPPPPGQGAPHPLVLRQARQDIVQALAGERVCRTAPAG